jgi:acyl-CoA reductase-like NAD-dependent aldehyde dehydrogenase
MTLTELSMLADKAVLHLVYLSSHSQSFTNARGGSFTWHDSCTFAVGGSLRNQLEIKEPTVPYRSVNPATGEVLKTFREHTDEQMWSALAKADKAFRAWAARPYSERSKIIGRSAQILLEKKEELSRLATLEMGKRIAESRGEVELSASILQYFADNAESFLAPKKLHSAMGDARLEYSPPYKSNPI